MAVSWQPERWAPNPLAGGTFTPRAGSSLVEQGTFNPSRSSIHARPLRKRLSRGILVPKARRRAPGDNRETRVDDGTQQSPHAKENVQRALTDTRSSSVSSVASCRLRSSAPADHRSSSWWSRSWLHSGTRGFWVGPRESRTVLRTGRGKVRADDEPASCRGEQISTGADR